MSLDQPGSSTALWNIYAATSVRPEWLLPVLSYESGLNPNVANAAGSPYYGISQNSAQDIQNYGRTDPQSYMMWPASMQLQNVVLDYLKAVVSKYGKLKSGIQVYQAIFYPASLAYAKGLDDTIVAAPSAAYEDNRGFDVAGKGRITPRDLASAVASQVLHPAVQAAIAAAYAQRPLMRPTDPVYGNTQGLFGLSKSTWLAIAIGAAGGLVIYSELYGMPKPLKVLRKQLAF